MPLLLLLLVVVTLDPTSARATPPRIRWERLPLAAAENAPTAVARDASGTRLAVAIDGGVLAGPIEGPLERVLRRGPVHDVAFAADGSLLAATGAGLYRIGVDGTVARERVGTGETRAARRLAILGELAAVATAGGVFGSTGEGRWERLVGLPPREATTVALRAVGGTREVWSVIDGQLWVTSLRVTPLQGTAAGATAARPEGPAGVALVSGPSRRLRIPLVAREDGPVDVVFGLTGDASTAVLFPTALAVRDEADASWRILRPTLPPGAVARRLGAAWLGATGPGATGPGAAAAGVWLATDAGLLLASSLAGPWERATPPAGSAEVRDAVGGEAALYVATHRDLLRAVPIGPALVAARALELPPDPGVDAVHRAALAYLALEPARMEALRRGVSRRGWLPLVTFRAGHDRDAIRRRDFDQSFVSGGTHQLLDYETDSSRDLLLLLTLTWDLGDLAYHPDSIDISRESRAVVSLRDDVLDEITQLYFERRRVLVELASLAPDAAEVGMLRLRADELAAGLDAWTGGWWSRHAPPP